MLDVGLRVCVFSLVLLWVRCMKCVVLVVFWKVMLVVLRLVFRWVRVLLRLCGWVVVWVWMVKVMLRDMVSSEMCIEV